MLINVANALIETLVQVGYVKVPQKLNYEYTFYYKDEPFIQYTFAFLVFDEGTQFETIVATPTISYLDKSYFYSSLEFYASTDKELNAQMGKEVIPFLEEQKSNSKRILSLTTSFQIEDFEETIRDDSTLFETDSSSTFEVTQYNAKEDITSEKSDANYQTMFATSIGVNDVKYLDVLDVQVNVIATNLSSFLKQILPDKEPATLISSGVYFGPNKRYSEDGIGKPFNWMSCYSNELNTPLANIISSTRTKEPNLTFAIENYL
uniref:HORMA domain-containing protein n=1 Tax=Rhabditophanes sp. KR3021 TaxID=114890 RepID=A0AC35UCF3_9BILA